jgi:NAD(P)-dependent dehydrogenase (short-subunit alcohol dehydrogenase family)
VLSVQPGPIRTEFAGRSIAFATPLHAYAETAARRHHWIRERDGRQSGDPDRIAALIVAASVDPTPPRRLFVGNMSMELAARRADAIRDTIECWRTRSADTDFPTQDG